MEDLHLLTYSFLCHSPVAGAERTNWPIVQEINYSPIHTATPLKSVVKDAFVPDNMFVKANKQVSCRSPAARKVSYESFSSVFI